MTTPLDAHGQPLNTNYNYNRRVNRALNELIGFMRGLVADAYVSEEESAALAKWVVGNREIADIWPVNTLVQRIEKIYADGVADEEERSELRDVIQEIVGRQDDESLEFGPTDLPLTKPLPDVIFDGNEFVLTGKFLYGPRRVCQREIELRGGKCADNVRLQTSYLVIGSLMSRDWKFSSYGNKIVKAVDYSNRCSIAVISEKHWESFILSADGKARATSS